MAHRTSMVVAVLLACFAVGSWQVRASDPELTSDFAVPDGVNATTLDGNFFTSNSFRNVSATPSANFATVLPLNVGKFPALTGLGVSSALLLFPRGTINVPHTHPRGTELLLVLQGPLDVGLIDTTNKLFVQTLQTGDSFVFPKGLVHFQINNGNAEASAVAAFSSSNPGLVRLPNTLFKSNIDNNVLAKAFGVSVDVITQLKSATVN
jgi:quercetin dioxygenase-like cupin family protein